MELFSVTEDVMVFIVLLFAHNLEDLFSQSKGLSLVMLVFLFFCRRNRIIAAAAPGMTTHQPFKTQPYSFENTMGFNGLYHIL